MLSRNYKHTGQIIADATHEIFSSQNKFDGNRNQRLVCPPQQASKNEWLITPNVRESFVEYTWRSKEYVLSNYQIRALIE